MSAWLFVGSVFMIFFAYFGYPLSLKLMRPRHASVRKMSILPSVTFIIAAYNEEKRIRQKLEDTLALDYPGEKFQVIVASDGSTDGTADIVGEFEGRGVDFIQMAGRSGKEKAQKAALGHARGDIVIFSDVATALDPHGVRVIVANFADPSVGCVSSEDRLLTRDGKPCGEGAYVRYEMWVRRVESEVHSVVGLSGSFFAARKEVCRDFSGEMQSDFRMLLSAVEMGYRGVSDPKVLGYYKDIADPDKELERKVRTVVRGLTVFFESRRFLNPFRFGLFAYQLLGHKLCRWLVPFFLVIAFGANLVLALSSFFFCLLFVCQAVFYGIAAAEYVRKVPFAHSVLRIPGYFVTVNIAIALAWKLYWSGHRIVMWTSSER
ncbi:glycosyltransferase family 2 protein [Desulfoluna spongiiphila]|uniref:glycosyltransferase family 2 protein n=1 Tax=Desulfoluna spongiiphila TaxID=419481 RepID=UPI00125A4120|nr:glycosyltransferase family 2 protein [Desulfoluna spongiiphila]VVS94080.1 nucleotide-diphospho-sugar transferases [Desulfoluna spongiiphila]